MKKPQDKINHFIAEWREEFSPSTMKTMVNGVEVTGIYTGKVPSKIEAAMMAIELLTEGLVSMIKYESVAYEVTEDTIFDAEKYLERVAELLTEREK